MTRQEFVKYSQTGKLNKPRTLVTQDKSVTDPTFAQTGRQMLNNPLNIECRVQYSQGVALDKENPLHIKEYDKMYPDAFKGIRQAQGDIKHTKGKLKEIQASTTQVVPAGSEK